MKLRLGFVLLATLVFASLASAQTCANCVDGVCQQSDDGFCMKTCCNRPVGSICKPTTLVLECVVRSPVPYYFTSRMPQQMEGSRLRVQYVPAVKAPPLKCGAVA
jgi:hypothetical protein